MKKSRIAIGLVALSVMFLSLAACGSKKEDSSQKDGKITLTLLTYEGARDSKGDLVMEDMAKSYMKSHPNINVKVDLQAENNSQNFLTKLDLLQMSGKTGDVIHLPEYRSYATRAKKGFFLNMDSNLKKDGGYSSMYNFPSKVSGHYYAVPYQPGIYMTYINKTMLDAAGASLPDDNWDWNDYAELAKKMTTGSGSTKVYGSYMHTWTEFRREGLFNSVMDNPYIKANGKSNLSSPQFKDWLEYMKKLEKDGSQLPYSDAKSTNMNYLDVFLQGKAAMMVMGTWINSSIVDTEKYPHDFQTVMVPMPRFEDGKEGVTQGGCSYHAVSKTSKHPKEAYDLAKFLSDKGAVEQNVLPATKDGDVKSVMNAIVGDKKNLLDINSAIKVWNNATPNIITRYPDKFVEIDSIYNTETEKYILGNQNVDTTMKNIEEQADPIISK